MREPTASDTVRDPGADPGSYRVLARKYRPTTFAELIGQEAMVQTLTNAFRSGRLAHAFMLTGVRGVGKTTTARIIARALNCVGPDGAGGPTVEPCGQCLHCRAIAEDRHVDVLEMDAASRTRVEEMRELLDGVRYRPTSARFKVYIIDEVHMLSIHSFNALLKTLEEPPAHVKFIFATTEVRKVPVTVLSRCQRFDLRRVEAERLVAHFATIAAREGATVAPTALHLIARAADGSVRDGLSLLDQAIAHGGGMVGEDEVRQMLGLADRAVTFDLLDAVMRGGIADALALMAGQYQAGADPAQVLEDLLDLVHWLTRVKITPGVADRPGVAESERVRGRTMADGLPMSALTRAWQILLKGLGEVRVAPSPMQAAEMVLVRLAYAAELPTPAEALRQLRDPNLAPAGEPSPSPGAAMMGPVAAVPPATGRAAPSRPVMSGPASVKPSGGGAPRASAGPAVATPAVARPASPSAESVPSADPTSFAELAALAEAKREMVLWSNLIGHVHPVRFEPGHLEFRPGPGAPADLANALSRFLNAHTGRRWVVSISSEAGEPTLQQRKEAEAEAEKATIAADPLVRAVLEAFPGATIERVRRSATPEFSDGGADAVEFEAGDDSEDR